MRPDLRFPVRTRRETLISRGWRQFRETLKARIILSLHCSVRFLDAYRRRCRRFHGTVASTDPGDHVSIAPA
jgi:hypothetical protein